MENTEGSMKFNVIKEDWSMWSQLFLANAEVYDYTDRYEGTTTIPATAGDAVKEEEKLINKKAWCHVLNQMSTKEDQMIILNAKTTVLPKGCAKEAWDRLLEKY